MLINVSRFVFVMLMTRTNRVAVEVLIELAGRGPQEWMNVVELGRGRAVHGEETSGGSPELVLTAEKRL